MDNYTEYEQQIKEMALAAKIWWKLHPSAEAKIQFNFGSDGMFFGTVSSAIRNHVIAADDSGRQFLKDICYSPNRPEPTVMMLKIALEIAKEGLNGKDKGN